MTKIISYVKNRAVDVFIKGFTVKTKNVLESVLMYKDVSCFMLMHYVFDQTSFLLQQFDPSNLSSVLVNSCYRYMYFELKTTVFRLDLPHSHILSLILNLRYLELFYHFP